MTLRPTRLIALAILCGLCGYTLARAGMDGVAVDAVDGAAVDAIDGAVIVGAGGFAPDVSEDFEGTGTPTGWTVAAGAPNFDQDTTGLSLQGDQCLYNAGNAGAVGAYFAFTASDDCYAYFLMRFEDNPTGFRRFLAVKNNTTTLLDGTTSTDAGGQVQIAGTAGGTTIAVDTTYHVWVEYERGTGANAQKRMYISTTGTKPGSPSQEITTGSETAQANRFYFETWAAGGGNVYFDKVRMSRTTPFGDNPP